MTRLSAPPDGMYVEPLLRHGANSRLDEFHPSLHGGVRSRVATKIPVYLDGCLHSHAEPPIWQPPVEDRNQPAARDLGQLEGTDRNLHLPAEHGHEGSSLARLNSIAEQGDHLALIQDVPERHPRRQPVVDRMTGDPE